MTYMQNIIRENDHWAPFIHHLPSNHIGQCGNYDNDNNQCSDADAVFEHVAGFSPVVLMRMVTFETEKPEVCGWIYFLKSTHWPNETVQLMQLIAGRAVQIHSLTGILQVLWGTRDYVV